MTKMSHNFSDPLGLRKQAIGSKGIFDAPIHENNISRAFAALKKSSVCYAA